MTAAVVLVAALGVSNPAAQAEKFQKDVAAARAKAVAFLLEKQKPDGSWEGGVQAAIIDMNGGVTALVVLSLLEAGTPADAPEVVKAAAYLAKLPPAKTYVVSLQTQALARAGAKKYATVIQANAGWLAGTVVRGGGELRGWSYPGNTVADGSNTHFAVMGLHAAARAGAKIDPKLWEDIRDLYTRTQTNDGWTYANGGPVVGGKPSESMTAAGLVGLALAAKHDGSAKGKPGPAFDKAMTAFAGGKLEGSKSEGYMLLVTAELGRAIGQQTFKAGNREVAWYADRAAKLVKDQLPSGAWTGRGGLDNNEVYSTACGLFFLGPPK